MTALGQGIGISDGQFSAKSVVLAIFFDVCSSAKADCGVDQGI